MRIGKGEEAHLLREPTELLVLIRNCHTCKITVIANGLEVAAYEEKVNLVFVLLLKTRELSVDGVKLSVAAAFDGNLQQDRYV